MCPNSLQLSIFSKDWDACGWIKLVTIHWFFSLSSLSLSAAPCVPQNIQNNLDCLSGVLNVTWQSIGYVGRFHTSVVSNTGYVSSCKTNKHHCIIRNMQCGLTYNVTVVAEDESCNSSSSPTEQVITGRLSYRWQWQYLRCEWYVCLCLFAVWTLWMCENFESQRYMYRQLCVSSPWCIFDFVQSDLDLLSWGVVCVSILCWTNLIFCFLWGKYFLYFWYEKGFHAARHQFYYS